MQSINEEQILQCKGVNFGKLTQAYNKTSIDMIKETSCNITHRKNPWMNEDIVVQEFFVTSR